MQVDEVITASSGDHTHLTCYSMEWQDYSHFQLCSLLANMPCPGSSSSSSVAGTRGTSKRINLRAKIISFQSEVRPSSTCIFRPSLYYTNGGGGGGGGGGLKRVEKINCHLSVLRGDMLHIEVGIQGQIQGVQTPSF